MEKMELRSRIEQVLRKYFYTQISIHPGAIEKTTPDPKLVADLLDLYGEPDRNALEQLFMAWSKSKSADTKPMGDWCQHWKRETFKEISGWSFVGETDIAISSESQWDICPVSGCHQPRPAERTA